MKQPEKISWWEPRWSYRTRLRKEFELLCNPWFWVRMELAVAVFLWFVFWLTHEFPEIEVPMERFIPAALLAPLGILAIPVIVLWWIPPQIVVDRGGIVVAHGQSARRILARQIRAFRLILNLPGRPLLQVAGDEKTLTCGVAEAVDSDQLESLARQWFPTASVERIVSTAS